MNLSEVIHRRKFGELWQDFLNRLALSSQRGADLKGVDLSGADLSGADLKGAYLGKADLSGADLSGADLSWADLSWASLSNAVLREVSLGGSDLSGANLEGADLRGSNGLIGSFEETQAFAAKLLGRIQANPHCLDMSDWHSGCGTAHCIAGWAYPEEQIPGAKASLTHPELAGLFYKSSSEAIEGLQLVSMGITTVKR